MKQHITVEQLSELSDKAKEKLTEWWKPKDGDCVYIPSSAPVYSYGERDESLQCELSTFIGDSDIDIKDKKIRIPEYSSDNYFLINLGDCLPLLSIGQMVEFIGKIHIETNSSFTVIIDPYYDWDPYVMGQTFVDDELCNALWEAVKFVLSNLK